MLHLLQPLFAALTGAALFVFGLIHSVKLMPDRSVWRQMAAAAPQVGGVLLFLACVVVLGAGVTLFVAGIRSARRRFAQLRHMHCRIDPGYDDPDHSWR